MVSEASETHWAPRHCLPRMFTMQITYCFRVRSFVLAAALGAGLNFASPAFAASSSWIFGPNGEGLTRLENLGGDYTFGSAINDAGQVAGVSRIVDDKWHAFITGRNGASITDLGTLGGRSSDANDINDAGQVVGYSDTAAGVRHAFITGPNGVGMTDLGTLGGLSSFAYGINATGQVVGYSDTAGRESHAFFTGPDGVGITDLNSLVDLPDGDFLDYPTDINNLGQVVIILSTIPEPSSYALMLAGLGLIGFMARHKKRSVEMPVGTI